MKQSFRKILAGLIVLNLFFMISCQQNVTKKPNTETEKKVEDLLKQMTLEEKIGQMTQMCASTITLNGTKELDLDVDLIKKAIQEYHIGSFLSGTGSAQKWVKFLDAIQKIAINETRLKIPIIFGIDHVHGANYVDEGTFFPHNLTLSCSFDPQILTEGAKVTAKETAPLAMPWNFAPVLDVGKNPYWPRIYETFGEDPLVCGVLGTAFIKAYQECDAIEPYKLSACAKHFIAYSDPKSGYDRTPAEIPNQILFEQFLPPFEMAIKSGNVKTVMVNSGELNGEPVHASKWLLTDILRGQLGFQGVILTDIKDIMKIVEMHAGAATEKEATLMSINAGIDMYMACNSFDFCQYMKELVQEGKITEARINESVHRILTLKYELGLFENPLPDDTKIAQIGSKEHFNVAKKAAEESIVLLKNENILPLKNAKNIMLTGFAANSKKMLNGAWTLEWLGCEEERQPKDMNTIYTALQKEFKTANINLIEEPTQNSASIVKFISEAKKNDVIVITAGEQPYSEFKGNANDLELDENQLKMIEYAKSTKKPVILVLIEGRPRVITRIEKMVDAVIFAGHPGVGGADAIAGIISGRINPSGKLSFTYPLDVGHCVPYYHKFSEKYTALYPFGHGLSFSNFEYSNLTLSDTLITSENQEITATIDIKNTSNTDGKEVVLWYINDEFGTITRPVKQLKFFKKAMIKAGETKQFKFTIKPMRDLTYPDKNGKLILENGSFKVIVNQQEIRFWLKK